VRTERCSRVLAMESKRSSRWVTLNELICELAYGRRMTYAEMVEYEVENQCAPASPPARKSEVVTYPWDNGGSAKTYAGGIVYIDGYSSQDWQEHAERKAEALRSEVYCEARDFLFEHAEAGSAAIYARNPEEDERHGGYTRISAIYRQIPKEAFIAEHLFAPDEPPVIWPKEGCLVGDAEWFYPKLKVEDAVSLANLWRNRESAVAGTICRNPHPEMPMRRGVSQQNVNAAVKSVAERLDAEGRRPDEEEMLAEVRKFQPNATRDQVREARRLGFVPPEWSKVGAPKKLRGK
jgi:hypothetical protein